MAISMGSRAPLWATAFVFLPISANACQLALALAIDVSGSIDAQEYEVQMQGLSAALRDPTIADALASAEARLSLVQWTGDSRQEFSIPWTDIKTVTDSAIFADTIDATPRRWRHFSTAIGSALDFTVKQFGESEDCARRVIDLSGDGFSNEGIDPASIRKQIWDAGFTVNGLAIETGADDLTTYYWENVAIGDKAFVMTANGFEDYPKRIKLKLLREVTQQVSNAPPLPPNSRLATDP
jgi:Ca-activated chloride channel homolog